MVALKITYKVWLVLFGKKSAVSCQTQRFLIHAYLERK